MHGRQVCIQSPKSVLSHCVCACVYSRTHCADFTTVVHHIRHEYVLFNKFNSFFESQFYSFQSHDGVALNAAIGI